MANQFRMKRGLLAPIGNRTRKLTVIAWLMDYQCSISGPSIVWAVAVRSLLALR